MKRQTKIATQPARAARLEIFAYHDYRLFLKDWLASLKAGPSRLSMREVAARAGISCATLPSVLAGKRKMSADMMEKLLPHLDLNREELEYLRLLRSLSDSDSADVRQSAFEQIKRLRSYREKNPREVDVYHYLDNWYYVAIRELTALPDFIADPRWIAERLQNRITPQQAEQALEFLVKSGHLKKASSGKLVAREKDIDCVGGVYRLAIGSFHQQMLKLSSDIIRDSKNEGERYIMSYTLALSREDLEKLREIIGKGIENVASLERKSTSPDSVYHVTMMGIPLTSTARRSE